MLQYTIQHRPLCTKANQVLERVSFSHVYLYLQIDEHYGSSISHRNVIKCSGKSSFNSIS